MCWNCYGLLFRNQALLTKDGTMAKIKKFSLRRKITAALVSSAVMSAGAYFWTDIVRLAPVVVNKVMNRQTVEKPNDARQVVPGIFTSFQRK